MIKNYSKLLLLSGGALLLSACSSDDFSNIGNNGIVDGEGNFKTATFTVNNSPATRAIELDSWSESTDHGDHGWETKMNFSVPADAEDCTVPNYGFNQNAKVFKIPAEFSGQTPNWFGIPDGGELYVEGNVTNLTANINGKIKVYVCEGGSLTFGPTSGNLDVYNKGNLKITSFANIDNVYNMGNLEFENQWGDNDIRNEMSIYSKDGTVSFNKKTDLKANCDIHDGIVVNGDLNVQNGSSIKYICGVEVKGNLTLPDHGLETSYVKANTITLNGHPIKLLEGGLIEANRIEIPNSNSTILGYAGSHGLVRVKELYFTDNRNFDNSFSDNIFFSFEDGATITQTNENKYNVSVDDYILNGLTGETLNAHLNTNDIAGAPACGPSYGSSAVPPVPSTDVVLRKIAIIESPDHDHNIDKTNGYRKLSATCIDFDGEKFYVSYHMRGGNYANDDYAKDDVEGCIETWSMTNKGVELGKYMWTNNFDFNHLIIDGSDIIVVGHYDNKGAIIGKLSNSFANFGVGSYPEEFYFKYLTTDEKKYDEFVNPDSSTGNATVQFVDYENAGDGNCVIRVGNEYFVSTYAGYGKLDLNFNRVVDESGNIAFVRTPGSAKHIITKGEEIAVLYLNDRPESTASATSSASVALINRNSFPFGASTSQLNGLVGPVDGKNVLAWNGTNLFACMGKGGLNVDNTLYNYGENKQEPVNGVAFSGNYIYLASGSHLRVLDVNTMQEVTHYTIPNKSANYIKVANIGGVDYIAVAFGQEGIQVFRLEE